MELPATIGQLEKRFEDIAAENPREAAEAAFALATYFLDHGDISKAKRFAERSIALFLAVNVQSYDECTTIHNSICGILMPDLIHENVVRHRFANLNLAA